MLSCCISLSTLSIKLNKKHWLFFTLKSRIKTWSKLGWKLGLKCFFFRLALTSPALFIIWSLHPCVYLLQNGSQAYHYYAVELRFLLHTIQNIQCDINSVHKTKSIKACFAKAGVRKLKSWLQPHWTSWGWTGTPTLHQVLTPDICTWPH